MSYILEALNKSEQERRARQTPDLNTLHRQVEARPGNARWLWFAGIMLLGNLGGLGYWLMRPDAPHNRPDSDAVSQPAVASQSAPPLAPRSAPLSATRVNPEQTNPAPGNAEPTPMPDATQSGELITPPVRLAPAPVRITELPLNVQRQVPDLQFSSHLYSDDAEFRMVNINGRMIREGDVVADGLTLHEITEEGVVLHYLHYYFEVSVLRDWRFD